MLEKLREIDIKLNEPRILIQVSNESDQTKREAFNKARSQVAVTIRDIEHKIISNLLIDIQSNESSFKKGIEDLDSEIQTANDIAKITAGIDKVLTIVSAVLSPIRARGMRNLYALLVGIDNYPDPNHRLEGCVNDITAIEEYLNERFDQKEHQLHLRSLKDSQATRKAVIDGFRSHLSLAGADDIVLFYYSGHGSQELAPKEFWHLEPDHHDETLVCYDSLTENSWGLADKELAGLIAEVAQNNPHMTIIMDCCHSGSGTRDPMQQTKERRLPADKRERPLDSFIFTLDDFNRLLGTRKVKPEDNPTGWNIPKGRHVLLAACQD